MKIKRPVIIRVFVIFAFLILLGFVSPAIRAYLDAAEKSEAHKAMRALPMDQLQSAVAEYSQKQKADGRSVPDFVSVQDLVSGGYLRADAAGALKQMEAFANTRVGTEMEPQVIVLKVSIQEYWMAIIGDGSIQMQKKKKP
jgi:hypothetical protein